MNFKPVIIYLDTNAWIYLSKVHYKKTNIPEAIRCYNLIAKLVKEGKIILPLSIVHAMELRNHNAPKLTNLVTFMLDFSKNYAILPYIFVNELEITNYIRKKRNLSLLNISELTIGKGIKYLLGNYTFEFNHNNDPIVLELIEYLNSDEIMKKIMFFEFTNPDSNFSKQELIYEMEKTRSKKKIKDKDYNKRLEIALFLKEIMPAFYDVLNKYNLNINEIFNEENIKTQKFWFDLLNALPSQNVLFWLTYKTGIQRERKIKINDIYDIRHLAMAVPYCDIVVTDKERTADIIEKNLDVLYNTKVISNYLNLPELLEKRFENNE